MNLAFRLVPAAVLIYAGATKAAGPAEEFALIIGAYGLLPKDFVISAAYILPWAELLLGWALLLGFPLRAAAAGCAGLFGVFLLGLGSVLARGLNLPSCGCFGESVHLTTGQALGMDAALLALCVLAWRTAPSPLSLDAWSSRGR